MPFSCLRFHFARTLTVASFGSCREFPSVLVCFAIVFESLTLSLSEFLFKTGRSTIFTEMNERTRVACFAVFFLEMCRMEDARNRNLCLLRTVLSCIYLRQGGVDHQFLKRAGPSAVAVLWFRRRPSTIRRT